jgi:hypothetical protein
MLTPADNYTYSIDIGAAWTLDSVSLHQIPKGPAPVLNDEGLWPDPSGETFYAYGGGVSYVYDGGGDEALPVWEIPEPPENQLWQFTPSTDGASGQWSEVSVSPSSNYTTLVRTVSSSYGYGGGFGFSIGGQQNAGTDSLYADNLATISAPGMVMYDISAQEWYNISTKAISFYETAITGTTHYVPSFGSAGLLFLLGGEAVSGRVVLYPDTLPHSPFSFEEIYMFDPSTRQWLSQTTTGDRPSGVNYLCATGLQGDDNTYEVCM